MPSPYLNERHRVEMAIPSRLLFGLSVCDCFSDPDNSDLKRIKSLLMSACLEPIVGLSDRDGGKVARRVERVTYEIAKMLDQQPGIKVALTLFYFVKELLDDEILILWDGSDLAQALELLLPMMEAGFDVEKQDKSAQKQARKLLQRLQCAGYYR